MNPKILNILLNNYRLKKEEENRIMDTQAWLTGIYVQEAIASALAGRKHRYPGEPYMMRDKQQEMSGEEKFKLWAMEFNKRFEG